MRSNPAGLGDKKFFQINTRKWASLTRLDRVFFNLSVKGMYMLCFAMVYRFDFNMATTNTSMTTVKISNKIQSL